MNKVVLVGRLTRDPELRFLPNTGNGVCRFTLAVKRQFKKDEADFINCTAFGKTAEIISQYLTKGREIAVSGSIRTGSYEAQDGTKKYTTEVWIESFDFISSNQGVSSSAGSNDDLDMTPVDDDGPF